MPYIPHMPDYCPICGKRNLHPLPGRAMGYPAREIPSAEHTCDDCGHRFTVFIWFEKLTDDEEP